MNCAVDGCTALLKQTARQATNRVQQYYGICGTGSSPVIICTPHAKGVPKSFKVPAVVKAAAAPEAGSPPISTLAATATPQGATCESCTKPFDEACPRQNPAQIRACIWQAAGLSAAPTDICRRCWNGMRCNYDIPKSSMEPTTTPSPSPFTRKRGPDKAAEFLESKEFEIKRLKREVHIAHKLIEKKDREYDELREQFTKLKMALGLARASRKELKQGGKAEKKRLKAITEVSFEPSPHPNTLIFNPFAYSDNNRSCVVDSTRPFGAKFIPHSRGELYGVSRVSKCCQCFA